LCKAIVYVEDFSEGGAKALTAVIVPTLSDMKSGRAHWRFERHGETTRISFTACMALDFWIPPLIGPVILKHWLRAQLAKSAENLERLAGSKP
jgi:hypothetical protein